MGSRDLSHLEAYFRMAASSPGLGSPLWRRNPPGNVISAGRTAGLRGRMLSGLVRNAPKSAQGAGSRASGAKPSAPAAFIRGFSKVRSRFGITAPKEKSLQDEGPA